MKRLTVNAIALFSAIFAPACWAGTATFSCPKNSDDGDHCVVTILTSSGGARNFPLPDGKTVRETVNNDDKYCVIPILEASEVQCTREVAKPIEDYQGE